MPVGDFSSRFQKLPQSVKVRSLMAYNYFRSAVFLSQNLSLPLLEFLVTGKKRKADPEFQARLGLTLKKLKALLDQDSEHVASGLFPLSVVNPSSLLSSAKQWPSFVRDGVKVAAKRQTRESHDFSAEAQSHLQGLPSYFQRNFHYQTDGYLSKDSAELYEHQVEVLFAGAAEAMRRLMLPSLLAHFPQNDGQGLKFLEIGAGTGGLTKFVRACFPKAQITLLDLSGPYLAKAQKELNFDERCSFVQGDGAELDFKRNSFDAVYSCFLFHELPLTERKKVISESARVLKKQGYFGLVDSLQYEDDKDLQWGLQQFPIDFHEPFYTNYIKKPLEPMLESQGLNLIAKDTGFFSKSLAAVKL
jgi:ubiquinone/menaquinone biosynthesis C-methylase UbiE